MKWAVSALQTAQQAVEQNPQAVRNGGDLIGLATWGAWFAGAIPAIGLTLTAIWTYFRLVEMVTGKPFHQTRTAACIRRLFRVNERKAKPNQEQL